jgi:DNA-binding HxlR family transcriptional regulator
MPFPKAAGKYEIWTDNRRARWQTSRVRGTYGQYCPVSKAAEVLGERWTLLIVRDLMLGAHRFTDLHRGLPGLSRSLLAARLRELERAGLVERRVDAGRPGYWLTPLGEDLQPALMALGEWATRSYSREPRRDELDPTTLMLWVQRRVNVDRLPSGRFLARFEFGRTRPPRAWLLVEDGAPSVCRDDPGFESDLVVTTDPATLHRIFAGRLAIAAALRDGSLRLEGAGEHVRNFTRWFGLSPFAESTRVVLARGA